MLEIRLPKEIELKLRKEKDLKRILKRRVEIEVSNVIKQDLFLLMLFDKLLEDSELKERDVEEIDRRVKRGIMEKTGWI